MPAQLMALSEGPSILLDKPILLLGRHPECDIQIDSRKISRRHCCIAQVNNYLVVRDLGSTNGIRINGSRVTEGRLATGDELTIGNHRYQVQWGAEGQSRPRPKKKDTLPSNPEEPGDDLLESCDEPVPLAENGRQMLPAAPAPRAQPPLPSAEDVYILPEHIELLPDSGAFPNIPKPSGSHHAP